MKRQRGAGRTVVAFVTGVRRVDVAVPLPWLVAVLIFVAVLTGRPATAQAEATVVRVLSESAEVRTGPGFAYRSVYVARQGEVLPVVDRAPASFWFRVALPDGTWGWILGDEVLPVAVDPRAPGPPSLGTRFVRAVFSPPPLVTADVQLAFSAGLLGGEGMVLFRPAWLLAPHLSLAGFVGETVGEQVDVLHYGLGANLFLWPQSPVTLFFGLGGGAAHGRRKADQFVVPEAGRYLAANAGAGLLVALKKRITFRFDCRTYAIFEADYTRSLMEYSGGLAVLF
ncbi:MAG TPA: SH3 domain-containing protein [Polyangia bacterium]